MSAPGWALAAMIASRREQSPPTQAPLSSAVLVTVKISACARLAPPRPRTLTHAPSKRDLSNLLRELMLLYLLYVSVVGRNPCGFDTLGGAEVERNSKDYKENSECGWRELAPAEVPDYGTQE